MWVHKNMGDFFIHKGETKKKKVIVVFVHRHE